MSDSTTGITTPERAWERLVGDQTVAEWREYGGPTTADGIAAYYLGPGGTNTMWGLDDISPDEILRLARLLAAWIADHGEEER